MITQGTFAGDSVELLAMLDSAACEQMTDKVLELRASWMARRADAPFYTLGAAGYLDASLSNPEPYQELTRRLNPILAESFAPLYARLTAVLTAHLGRPVVLSSSHALPGFHIYLAHPAFLRLGASIHVDVQHESLDWGGKTPEDVISYTLPVALPAGGGGMDVWSLDRDEWLSLTRPERLAALKRAPRRDVVYSLGGLALHSGRLVHRIAARPLFPDDRRITLQGHGVLIDGEWQLYW